MKKVFYMRLNEEPFSLIKCGSKTVELRLFDEKRRALSVGDEIVFQNRASETEAIKAEIIALHKSDSFVSLLSEAMLLKSGFSGETKQDAADIMRKYYTEEDEQKFGVVGIEIRLVRN